MQLEISKVGAIVIEQKGERLAAFGLKEFALINQEKLNMSETIIRSGNSEVDNFFTEVKDPSLN